MSLKKRFLILGLIFTTFLVTACAVLIFSLGYTFDFANKRFVATGTLVAYSVPKGAEIFLNGKSTGKTTPATIRLLPPGEYDVRLQKSGYAPWEKHFSVIAQQVTWTSEPDGKVALFLSNTVPVLVASSALDLFWMNNATWFATATSTLTLQNAETQESLPLKLPPPRAGETLTATADGRWALKSGSRGIFTVENLSTKEIIALSQFNLNFAAAAAFGKNGLILRTAAGQLYQYDLDSKILSLRRQFSQSFAVDGDQLYFLDGASAYVTNRASSTIELVAEGLPKSRTSRLVPAGSHGLFALFDDALYRLDQTPQLLARNVAEAAWDGPLRTLIFNDTHALWIFDPEKDASPVLILRTSNDLGSPVLNAPSGQTFFLENGKLKAVETRAKISRRVVEFPIPGFVQKFQVSADGSTLYWITPDQNFYLMKIR